MKKKSFLHILSVLMRIQMAMLAVVLAVFLVMAYRTAEDKQRTALGNYTSIYKSQIENRLSRCTDVLSELVYGNTDLDMLRSSSEAERQYAAVNLSNDMVSLMRITEGPELLLVAEASQDLLVSVKDGGVTLAEEQELKELAMLTATTGNQLWEWQVYQGTARVYLYRALVQESRAVLAVVSAEALLSDFPAEALSQTSFYLKDAAGQVLGQTGEGADKPARTMLSWGTPLENGVFELYGSQSRLDFFQQISSYAVLLFGVLLVLVGFGLYYARRTRQELLLPMSQMTRDMEAIQNGRLDLRISTESDSVEFQTLVDGFNRLVEEVVNLKIESYEKQLALLDTEQKYIRLQIKPHFFLNAMSTIVGLSRSGKNAEIETYINALSKNIRYMFASGLHTVPLQEEIRHVENYFEMQELKYPDGVLYFVDMDESVRDWPVPQMLIHTLVENEYKYAVTADGQIMVLIKLCPARWQGEEMLLVQVEDDGKGYPAQVLQSINGGDAAPRADGTRVGLASIKRLLELMYDREGLLVLSNVQPHGAMSQVYIPARPVRERLQMTIQESDL